MEPSTQNLRSSDDHYLKQELDELVQSEPTIFDFLQKATLDGLWYWDLENPEIEWMNDGFWELLGYDPNSKKHLASEWQDLIHPDDLQIALENFAKHSEDPNHPYDQIVRYRHADGSTVWVRCRGLAIRDAAGKPVRLLGAHVDITELKKAESKLRQAQSDLEQRVHNRTLDLQNSEQRFRDFAESSSDWFWEMGPDLRFTFVSERFESITGVPLERAIGRTREELGKPEHSDPNWAQHLADMKARQPFRNFEYSARNKNGDRVYFSTSGQPVFGKDGSFKGYRGVGKDITERKRVEEQLRQAQKMEAVGQLTGGLAHDFNNLLAVMLGNAELLEGRLGNDDKKLQAIIRAATRGAELTQHLLSFSRRQSLRPQSIDLDVVVTEMSNLLHRTLGETIEIEIILAPALWRAMADPGQLESAILNLAINARSAMPGGGKLTIESTNAPLDESYTAGHMEITPGDYVMLSVSDTGTGMTPEVIAHAFEPFFTTKDVGEGTGLGLSMVYGFVKQSGGEVVIDSEEGRGSRVRLYLPRAEAAADEAGQEAAAELPMARGETVLLVEDDPDVRTLAGAMLGDLGYRVLTAEDGQAGLAALKRSPGVDLLLSDVVLPGAMSGPNLAEQARHRSPDLKVLFMSGYAQNTVHHHTPLPQNAELLNKPFRKHDLGERLRALLDC